jgi:hypothetical protein
MASEAVCRKAIASDAISNSSQTQYFAPTQVCYQVENKQERKFKCIHVV